VGSWFCFFGKEICDHLRVQESFESRGTPLKPGLVMGLVAKENEECKGIAFKVDQAKKQEIFSYLQRRENQPLRCYNSVIHVQIPSFIPFITLENITLLTDDSLNPSFCKVNALVFLPIVGHVQYAANISETEKMDILCNSYGSNGTSLQYLEKSVHCLNELGIYEKHLNAQLKTAMQSTTN